MGGQTVVMSALCCFLLLDDQGNEQSGVASRDSSSSRAPHERVLLRHKRSELVRPGVGLLQRLQPLLRLLLERRSRLRLLAELRLQPDRLPVPLSELLVGVRELHLDRLRGAERRGCSRSRCCVPIPRHFCVMIETALSPPWTPSAGSPLQPTGHPSRRYCRRRSVAPPVDETNMDAR